MIAFPLPGRMIIFPSFTIPAALLMIVLTAAALPARAGDLSSQRRREILQQGLAAYDCAIEARNETRRAESLYRESAAAFEALAADGVRNPDLEYNLGNVNVRLGRLGQAVLHYRRGLRLDPSHDKLAANLAYARARVEPALQESGERRILRGLFFWHYGTSPHARLIAAILLSAAGWLALLALLRWRRRWLRGTGLTVIALGLACGASLAWQLHDESTAPPAVIVKGGQLLRLGKGEGFEPAMREPLGPGVELRILQRHGDWAEVRLHDGKEGWLPLSAMEEI